MVNLVHLGELLMTFKDKLKSRLVEPQKLHKDLEKFYLSKYLINELRDYYTIIEREAYYASRPVEVRARMACKKSWPICYLALENSKNKTEPHSLLLSSQFILSNFKANHFTNKKESTMEPAETFIEKLSNQKLFEEDLMMERQVHVCDCFDKEFAKMKNEVRIKISKQIANQEKGVPLAIDRHGSQETNQVYDSFIKKRRGTILGSHPDMSDYSQSVGSKPSHDITHYNNTRKVL